MSDPTWGINLAGIGLAMVKVISAFFSSMSSALPASMTFEAVALMTLAPNFTALSLIAFHTVSAACALPEESTSSHSAKLICFGSLLFTRSAACSAGDGGGGAAAMVKAAGGMMLDDALAWLTRSVQPSSLPR